MNDLSWRQPAVYHILSNSIIIGGSPCSGKSTLAEHLAVRYGLQIYQIDDYQDAHVQRCQPDRHPTFYNYLQLDWDARWMRSVVDQVEEVFIIFTERFEMVIEDLLGLDPARMTIIEGGLFPDLVADFRPDNGRSLFMVSTKKIQMSHYHQRTWIDAILGECSDPAAAFQNWMERDYQFGRRIIHQASSHGFPVIEVDGSMNVDEHVKQVEELIVRLGKADRK